MSNTDFVEILKKVRMKAQSSANLQQLLDYIDGQIDVLSMMSPTVTNINCTDPITAVTPKPVECDPKKFMEVLDGTGTAPVQPSSTTCRFHGAEFTARDLF